MGGVRLEGREAGGGVGHDTSLRRVASASLTRRRLIAGEVPSAAAMVGWSRSATYLRTTASRCRGGSGGDRGPQLGSSSRPASAGRSSRYRCQRGRVVVGHRTAGPSPVHVHGAPVRDREQPAAQVPGRAQRRVGRERLGPRLLGHVVAVDRSGEGVGEAGDVAPVGVDEGLEGGQFTPMERRTSWSCESRVVVDPAAVCRLSRPRVGLASAIGAASIAAIPAVAAGANGHACGTMVACSTTRPPTGHARPDPRGAVRSSSRTGGRASPSPSTPCAPTCGRSRRAPTPSSATCG